MINLGCRQLKRVNEKSRCRCFLRSSVLKVERNEKGIKNWQWGQLEVFQNRTKKKTKNFF